MYSYQKEGDMNAVQKTLVLGAIKSAVSSATGLILSLPLIDAEHFSITSWGGWAHVGAAVGVTVLISEARFWQQWANSGTSPVKP